MERTAWAAASMQAGSTLSPGPSLFPAIISACLALIGETLHGRKRYICARNVDLHTADMLLLTLNNTYD
jgi:hypothetical protein